MTPKTLRTLRGRSLSAVAGAGIALGVIAVLFGAAALSHAAVESVAHGTETKQSMFLPEHAYPGVPNHRNLTFATWGGMRTTSFTPEKRTDT